MKIFSGNTLPPQQLPFNKKTAKWAKKHLDWAEAHGSLESNYIRKSTEEKQINYDLFNGILNMKDLLKLINVNDYLETEDPEPIPHYPIMNKKLQVLLGEEANRVFEYTFVITNPEAISDREKVKKEKILSALKSNIEDKQQDEQTFQAEMEKVSKYFMYEYQDFREAGANELIGHYYKEYNFPLIFNEGFKDVLIGGEEAYQCSIVGGEPVLERLNTRRMRVLLSGLSNRIEDADMVILEDYWSPGKIVDVYHEELKKKGMLNILSEDDSGNEKFESENLSAAFISGNQMISDQFESGGFYFDPFNLTGMKAPSSAPYDSFGNIRVLKIYWKSRRKIKKVKSYDPDTGEEVYNIYPETHIIDKNAGEEEETMWINEAWEGTKIGKDFYVNMRPCPVQYNRISNPSRCHFGIVGQIYNTGEGKPFTLVDMLKPYNYLYDVLMYRLNDKLGNDWGTILNLDIAKMPHGWEIPKWLYYAKRNRIAVTDSFNEGMQGASTGKIVGALNNNSTTLISSSNANEISETINLLDYIEVAMDNVSGISKQREGNIGTRETVGGIDRATAQSAFITEWMFLTHDDVKKRALEVFVETAQAAYKNRSKKLEYVTSDYVKKVLDLEETQFCNCDFGIVLDNSIDTQRRKQKLETCIELGIQSGNLPFSAAMKLYNSSSMAEKIRFMENIEQKAQEQAQQQQQAEQQAIQQQMQADMQREQMRYQFEEAKNTRDNETRIEVAKINAQASRDNTDAKIFAEVQRESYAEMNDISRDELTEKERQFNEKQALEREKFEFEKRKHSEDNKLKDTISKRQIAKANKTSK